MAYQILLYRDAAKFLSTLSSTQQERIRKKLKDLKAWPEAHLDVRPMVGELKGYYRLRVGDFRVIFVVDEAKQIIYVDHIGYRRDVYR